MFEIYKVNPEDTIESISERFNISPSNLYELNGLTPDTKLIKDMNIIVPKTSNNTFTYYTIKQGDSLTKVAKIYNVNAKLLAVLNGLNVDDYIYPNQTIIVPNNNIGVYITQENDTINEIIEGFGVDSTELLNQNPKIYVIPDQIIIYKQN